MHAAQRAGSRTMERYIVLREQVKMSARSWLVDIMHYIEKLGRREFSLSDMYAFEDELRRLHPRKHIKEKIRQQL